MNRAQSHVVGVALLLGITTLALAGLTVAVGTAIDTSAGSVATGQVADGFDDSLRPLRVTGPHTGTVSITDGTIESEDRTLRLLNDSGVVASVGVGTLLYETDDTRVTFLSGAIVRGTPGSAVVSHDPPITTSGRALVVGAAALADRDATADISVGVGGGSGPFGVEESNRATTVLLHTTVGHSRTTFDEDRWRLGVETETPGAWHDYFRERGATTTQTDFDGDGVPSVVASFSGSKRAILIVHALNLEVAIRAG